MNIWNSSTLVKLIFSFWLLWWFLVFLSNFTDALAETGLLGREITFRSGNFNLISGMVDHHNSPNLLAPILFAIGLLFQAYICVVMFYGCRKAFQHELTSHHVYQAFIPCVGFFAAFLLLTELFIAYGLAQGHVQLFTASLLSLYVLDQLNFSDTQTSSKAE